MDWTATGRGEVRTSSRRASRLLSIESPQLSPAAPGPHAAATDERTPAGVPVTVRADPEKLICMRIGMLLSSSLTAITASLSSLMSVIVSMEIRSTPAQTSSLAIPRKQSRASEVARGPNGSRKSPSGPMEPATAVLEPRQPSLAALTALSTISACRPSRPWRASWILPEQKVSVVTMSAPASA